jgi:membrane protein DedA with SNARE-associated domain
MRLRKFAIIAALSIMLWNIAWGVVAYFLAEVVERVATQPWLVVGGLAAWSIGAFVIGLVRGGQAGNA